MTRWSEKDMKGLGLKISADGKASMRDGKTVIDDFTMHYDEQKGLFIPHEVMSSKNSKQLFTYEKTQSNGTQKVVPGMTDSEQVREYRKRAGSYYEILAKQFREAAMLKSRPLYIEFTFVRKSGKAKWDFQNLVQVVLDMMQEYHWIPGDDVFEQLPIPPMSKVPFLIDIHRPGVWIKIL